MPMWNSFLDSCPCGMQWLAEVWLGLPRTLPRASYHGQVEPSNLCVGFFLKTRGLTCALRGLLASSEDVFNKWCLPKSNGNVQTACKLKFLVFLVVPEKSTAMYLWTCPIQFQASLWMMGCLWTMLLMLEQIGCPLPERRALWGRRRPAMQMRRECVFGNRGKGGMNTYWSKEV